MLDFLLNPKSIALIGASRTPGKVGYEILNNLIDGGFEGEIIPVNPSTEEILGLMRVPGASKAHFFGDPVNCINIKVRFNN